MNYFFQRNLVFLTSPECSKSVVMSIICSRHFVLQAFDSWGYNIKQYYGKTTKLRDSDFTNNYLSYWTDNGKGLRVSNTLTFNALDEAMN